MYDDKCTACMPLLAFAFVAHVHQVLPTSDHDLRYILSANLAWQYEISIIEL